MKAAYQSAAQLLLVQICKRAMAQIPQRKPAFSSMLNRHTCYLCLCFFVLSNKIWSHLRTPGYPTMYSNQRGNKRPGSTLIANQTVQHHRDAPVNGRPCIGERCLWINFICSRKGNNQVFKWAPMSFLQTVRNLNSTQLI